MGYCTMCGSQIPDDQNVCSMCYGDVGYGNDGYYQAWAEQQKEEDEEVRYWENQTMGC
jgi:uncharacterized membrane protein YvbJ